MILKWELETKFLFGCLDFCIKGGAFTFSFSAFLKKNSGVLEKTRFSDKISSRIEKIGVGKLNRMVLLNQ